LPVGKLARQLACAYPGKQIRPPLMHHTVLRERTYMYMHMYMCMYMRMYMCMHMYLPDAGPAIFLRR
jgi:hypothetical protein